MYNPRPQGTRYVFFDELHIPPKKCHVTELSYLVSDRIQTFSVRQSYIMVCVHCSQQRVQSRLVSRLVVILIQTELIIVCVN